MTCLVTNDLPAAQLGSVTRNASLPLFAILIQQSSNLFFKYIFQSNLSNVHQQTHISKKVGVFIIYKYMNISIYIYIYIYIHTIYLFILFLPNKRPAPQWLTNWFHQIAQQPLNRLIGATCGLPNFQQFAQLLLCHTHPWRVEKTLLPKKKKRILQFFFFGRGTVVGNNLNITRWAPISLYMEL